MRGTVAGAVGLVGRVVMRPVVTATEMAHLLLASLASIKGQRRAAHGIAVRAMIRQIWSMGLRSLAPVVLIGFLIGFIGAVQLIGLLGPVIGSTSVWPILITVNVRELGPLVTALVVAGRAGTVMAARIAQMNVHKEFDALLTMGVNPYHHTILPRIAAIVISTLSLCFCFVAAAIAGSGVFAIFSLDIPGHLFLEYVFQSILPHDVMTFVLKASIFGVVIGTISSMRGLDVEDSPTRIPGTVSRALMESLAACVFIDGIFALLAYFRLSHLYSLFQ